MSAATSTPGAGNPAPDTTNALAKGDAAAQDAIGLMNAAFAFATKINAEITVAKTVDGSIETAAQQRPNIG